MIRELKVTEFESFLDLAVQHNEDAGLSGHDNIDRSHCKKQLRHAFIYQNWKIYVAERDGKMIGYIAGYVDTKLWNNTLFGEVALIFVHPDYRSKLVADELFDGMVAWFSEVGCRYYLASCMSWNTEYQRNESWIERATKYFESKGMNQVGYTYVQPIDRGF